MGKYLVKSEVDHNHTVYPPNSMIDLLDDVAQPLLESGAIATIETPHESPAEAPAAPSPEEVAAAQEAEAKAAAEAAAAAEAETAATEPTPPEPAAEAPAEGA